VHLDVYSGERVALLGPNGAGKSTLTHVMLGLLRPDAGEVSILGQTPRQALEHGEVGAMLQETGLMRDVRVRELVRLVAGLYGRARAEKDILVETGLTDLAGRSVSALSGGERQRLKLALALAGKPSLLFLDEPTVALDISSRRRFWEVLTERSDEGTTILFTTHNLQEAEQFADRIVVIKGGRIIADGPVNAIRALQTDSQHVEISFQADGVVPEKLALLPGVTSVGNNEQFTLLSSTDQDSTLSELYRQIPNIRGLKIEKKSFEDSIAQLLEREN
jgi:ABC-2 type transport system ATP-binding protein